MADVREHPEGDPKINEMIRNVNKMEVVEVWCLGCKDWRPMNAAYAKYVGGEIENCSICRDKS